MRHKRSQGQSDETVSPPLSRDQSDRKLAWYTLSLLLLVSVIWIALAQGVFFVGPSEWDDNLYTSVASIPRPMSAVASRYIHVWTLRLFNLVIDSRQTAGALYPTLLTLGLSWLGFFIGRRMAGTWCGLVAALAMPFYPALLKYITVPYCDTAMAFWGAAALMSALVAADSRTSRGRTAAIVASGVFCLLSAQCKETGIATIPPVIAALWSCKDRFKVALLWLGGCVAGLLLLSSLDGLFMKDFWWRWHWEAYFPKKSGGSSGGGSYRMSSHYIDILTHTDFLVFTLIGVAGAVTMFKKNVVARCTSIWALSVILFSSLISIRYHGVQALDRYCVAIGAPLVILGAYWVIQVWKQEQEGRNTDSLMRIICLAAAVIVTLGLALYGVFQEFGALPGRAEKSIIRYSYFMMPVAMVLLFAIPWLTSSSRFKRTSLVLLLMAAFCLNVLESSRYMGYKRAQLKPWVELTEALDKAGANLARWNLPKKPFARFRIARRCQVLSTRPADELEVRDIESLDELRENEWLFSSPEAYRVLEGQGWVPVVQGGQENVRFVVYRRPSQ